MSGDLSRYGSLGEGGRRFGCIAESLPMVTG